MNNLRDRLKRIEEQLLILPKMEQKKFLKNEIYNTVETINKKIETIVKGKDKYKKIHVKDKSSNSNKEVRNLSF